MFKIIGNKCSKLITDFVIYTLEIIYTYSSYRV